MTDPGAARRTEKRRLLQPLWSSLDAHLLPLLDKGALLAVSGGPDSRALLEAVARWPRRFEGFIHVASVDHGTRPESHHEAEAVVARASALGFDAHLVATDAALRGEAMWREARYRALATCARQNGLGVVVVAHHEGDVAEGVLLAFAGEGGGAFAPAREIFGVVVVRPFLGLSRTDLRLALTACGAADTFADPDAGSARARLRREVLGPLGANRPHLEGRLAGRARDAADDDEALAAAAAGLVVTGAGGVVALPSGMSPALARRAIRLALSRVWASGGVLLDPRDAAPAVDVAVALMRNGRPGHVDVAYAAIEVDAHGGVRVAGRPASTHDGRVDGVDKQLSAVRSVPMMEREDHE